MLVQRLDFGPDVRDALALYVRALERQWLSHARAAARRSRWRCAWCTSARTWRRLAACSRRPRPSTPPAIVATAPTTRHSPTCSSRTDRPGSTSSARPSHGMPCSISSRNHGACCSGEVLDDALTVAADFIDLKSPYMGGHSRRCSQLSADAARVLGLTDDAVTTLRRAALVHDFGTTAVSNSIWDKPGPLTRAGVRSRRASPDADRADAAPIAGAGGAEPGRVRAPRKVRRVRLPQASARRSRTIPRACVLAATEIYVGMTTERADRRVLLRRGRRRRTAPARLPGRARSSRNQRGARSCGSWRSKSPRTQPAEESGRALPSRSRCAASRRQGTHDAGDRRPALHLAQNRRSPHPAHLQQNHRIDARRRRSLGHAKRSHPVSTPPFQLFFLTRKARFLVLRASTRQARSTHRLSSSRRTPRG